MNFNGVSTLPSTENWESEFAELDNVRFELDLHPSARNRNRARFAPSGINGNRARLWECAGDSSSQRMSSLKRKYRARWRKIELEKDFVLERPKSSSVAQKQKLIQIFYVQIQTSTFFKSSWKSSTFRSKRRRSSNRRGGRLRLFDDLQIVRC